MPRKIVIECESPLFEMLVVAIVATAEIARLAKEAEKAFHKLKFRVE